MESDEYEEELHDPVTMYESPWSTSKTEMVETPYFREMGTDTPPGCAELPRYNYTQYDLFCLRTKLVSQVKTISSTCEPRFATYELDGVMRVFINLIDKGMFLPIDKDQASRLRVMLDSAIAYLPGYCMLIDSDEGSADLPSTWISSVLPFIDIGRTSVVDLGKMYVKLDNNADYEVQWSYLQSYMIDTLRSLYLRGAICLHHTLHRSVIERWSMISMVEQSGDEVTLHCPSWNDRRITSDPVVLMMNVLMGSSAITLTIGSNYTSRHTVAIALQGSIFHFTGYRVSIECTTFASAERLADRVEEALTRSPDNVGVISVIDTEHANEVRVAVLTKWSSSTIILYRTERSTVLSFTIPIHIKGEHLSTIQDIIDA